MRDKLDITPNPRILRTLGEIPFQPWQCLAELIDNSVDAFAETERNGCTLSEKKICVSWSKEEVAAHSRTIEVVDTGPGMFLAELQNAARAGYTNNDPVHNLGLFGMGFNIATARLGENTRLLSTRAESEEWTGIEIDFATLIHSRSFFASVVREPKQSAGEHGTKVIVSKLKGETYVHLRDRESEIRRQLENIYSPLLGNIDVEIYIQGKMLSPRRPCIWGRSRYISKEGRQIPAIIDIDRDLGSSLFDMERNSYLSRNEEDRLLMEHAEGREYPQNIIERQKRLRGWIGIQRYADTSDFGINFIRNGRKILISNKRLFSYENPLTGTSKLEYPVELGTTVGGRIVGEVHVDYLLPTYQKNDFDTTDPSWAETVEALRGVGPILPQDRKAMGYSDPNTSPVGLLVNAYRRVDAGTKCLFVERSVSRDFAERFRRGDSEFQSDDKWWEAAQEADRMNAARGAENAPDVDSGGTPSDDIGRYTDSSVIPTSTTTASSPIQRPPTPPQVTSKLDDLILKSDEMASWSGPYSYGNMPAFNVKVRKLLEGTIFSKGDSVPCIFFSDGIECDFVFNPRHPVLAQFPMEPRQLLSLYLAEKFKARDHLQDIGKVYSELIQAKLQDVRIDKTGLQEKAVAMFDMLREKMMDNLTSRKQAVVQCIHESSGEVEETVMAMLSNGPLIIKFQNKEEEAFTALQYVPYRTLLRLVDRFPEELFDQKVFMAPYSSLTLSDAQATERARNESKERILSFLKDAIWVVGQVASSSAQHGKDELARCAHSISFLSQEIPY